MQLPRHARRCAATLCLIFSLSACSDDSNNPTPPADMADDQSTTPAPDQPADLDPTPDQPDDMADMDTTPPPELRQLDAGLAHTCVTLANGAMKCWGRHDYGQLGDGTPAPGGHSAPVTVAGLTGEIASITVGNFHTCAQTDAGVQCWGFNEDRQLGDGTDTDRAVPTTTSGLDTGVLSIAAGGNHGCALMDDATMRCWGANGYSQLGDPERLARFEPITVIAGIDDEPLEGVFAFDAGLYHTCAVRADELVSGAVVCWGSIERGQGGDGRVGSFNNRPKAVIGLDMGATAVALGHYHSCARLDDGTVKCWGDNGRGQLGAEVVEGEEYQSTPLDVAGLSDVAAIGAGRDHSCALTEAGAVLCWGANGSGQLGDGTNTDRHTPATVTGLDSGVTQLAVGSDHACAMRASGEVLCWGANDSGQLGDGSREVRTAPLAVTGL